MVIAGGATQRALGRRATPDTRDLRYLLTGKYPDQTSYRRETPRRVARGPILDQGEQPHGVACALLAAMHAAPKRVGPSRTPSPADLDAASRGQDGSLRAGCKALKRLGLIRAYYWSFDLDEIVGWLGAGHGLVLGLDWYAAMSRPDETGLIRSWGRPDGGHAAFAFGMDPSAEVVWLQNSFGPNWGGWPTRMGRRDFKGCCRLPYEDLRKLLADNGEAVWLEKW